MKMKKKYLFLLTFLLIIPFSFAVQPTQQYNKILLSPFYVNSMTQNVNYNYNVSVIVPDGISSVKTAILTLDAWINPTRTFNAWMNNVQCNTKNYTISTTYASAGRGVVTFDCTNAIIPNKINSVSFVVTGGNIGSSTAWLDLTYMNNPRGEVHVHGTEYQVGDDAKVWLQLINNSGGYVTDGVCYVDIYTPDNQEYIENSQMSNMLHDGIYYFDLTAPSVLGVYPVIAKCYYEVTSSMFFPNGNYSMTTGTAVEVSPVSKIQFIDGLKWRFKEANLGGVRRLNFTLDVSPANNCTFISEDLLSAIEIHSYAKFDSAVNDNIKFEIYNWTSGTWILLPNQHLEGNVWRTTSNTIELNNITSAGLYNSSIGGFRLRMTDSPVADGADDDFDIDQLFVGCNQLSNPVWQEVRGSSELHVSYRIDEYVWNYSVRNLTYYKDVTNYSLIQLMTWNATDRNLTYYQNFSEPQVDLTNYSRISNLTASEVWNYSDRNLTYYPAQIDLTNYSRISNLTAEDVWNYTGNVTTNLLSQLASSIWNFVARYTHGVILN